MKKFMSVGRNRFLILLIVFVYYLIKVHLYGAPPMSLLGWQVFCLLMGLFEMMVVPTFKK